MSKVIFEFDPTEDKNDIDIALNGYKWKLLVQNLDEILRNVTKYDTSLLKVNSSPTKEELKVAETLREEIRTYLEGHNLNID